MRFRSAGRAALVLAALAAIALALGGCESTQEKSAQLEVLAKREKARHPTLTAKGLSIAHQSTEVKVLDASVLHSAEGAATAVTVINDSSQALRSVPISITVEGANGQTLYQNNGVGLEASLTEISSLPAHGSLTWVDDQLPAGAQPTNVRVVVGEAPGASRPAPDIEVAGVHLAEASTGETVGTVRNRSSVAQQHLVVYVAARRSGRIVAAGRAVLADVSAGASAPFQVFLVGSPAGAQLQASAPPTTFG